MRRKTRDVAKSKVATFFHCCFWTTLALAVAGCDATSMGTLGLGGLSQSSGTTTANSESYALIGRRVLNVTADDGVIANDAAASSVVATSGETEHGGTLQLNDDGSFLYQAPANFFGTDRFEYTANLNVGTMTGTASIKVYPEDATPVP